MIEALKAQNPGDAEEMHRDWIRLLLREYYDPMYVHQQSLKESRIIATGDSSALLPHVTDS
jgi:tRNA 2-selenouridine synthase